MFMRSLAAVVLGICLGGGIAEAVPLNAFPPNVQNFIIALLNQLPRDSQYQNAVAIRMLSPQGAQRVVGVIYTYANAGLIKTYLQYAAIAEYVRSHYVPPNLQQTFVNGLWGVSPAEERFAQQVFQAVLAGNQSQIGGSLPSPETGPGWAMGGDIPAQQFLQGTCEIRQQFLPPEQRISCQ